MFRAIRQFVLDFKWRRLMRPFDLREAEALKRGDMRALGRVKRERKTFVHSAIGWRRGVGH